jgi:hypothetical protein
MSVLVRIVLLMALALGSALRADEDGENAKQAEVARMKKIWEAIQAYKKANGEIPPQLSDLVPKFLEDKSLLVSPLEKDGPNDGSLNNDTKLPTSYSYEFRSGKGTASKETKSLQMEEFGGVVPILRCFLHGNTVLNISYDGDFYESEIYWETSGSVKQLLAKRGLGPGLKTGPKLRILITDSDGKPMEGVKVMATEREFRGLPMPDRPVTTGADGAAVFGLGDIANGTALFAFEKEGFAAPKAAWPPNQDALAPAPPPEILKELSDRTNPILRVKMTAAVHAGGILRDLDGKPIAKATISIRQLDDDGDVAQILGQGTSGDDGRWDVPKLLRNARIDVMVQHPEFRNRVFRPGTEGAPTVEAFFSTQAELQLGRVGALTGTVTAGGQPLAGATVWYMPPLHAFGKNEPARVAQAVTGADGKFSYPARADGDGTLLVIAKGFAPLDQKVTIGGREIQKLDLVLDAGQKRSGRLVQPGKKGVPNVPIVLIGVMGTFVTESPVIATTDAQGNFTWDHAPVLSKQPMQLQALLPDGRMWWFRWDCSKEKPLEVPVPAQPE